MFNNGVRGRRSRDGEGNSTISSNFVETNYPIPFIKGFEIDGQDDLAIDTVGGQTVVLLGNGFSSGLTLTLDGVSISPVTVLSDSRVSFTAPAKSAGTYAVVITNANGASAVLVPGIVFGTTPIFSTAQGNIGNFYETKDFSASVSASSDSAVTYEIASGTIPPGSSFSSAGVLTGTAPIESSSSTYTFTVKATDAELQDSTRQFNVTVNTDVVSWAYPTNGSTVLLDDSEANINLVATSAAGYPVSYTATALPTGFSLSSQGLLTGVGSQEETVESTLTATASVTGRTSTISISWSVRLGDQFFNQTTLLLNADTNTFITDASDNAFAITHDGDTRPSAFSPFDQGWATLINGSDFFETAQNSSLAFQGGGAFTWESWINFTVGGILYGSYTGPSNAGGSFTFACDHVAKNFGIGWIINGTDTWNFDNYSDNDVLTLDTWHHIAASYDGAGVLRYFVDGTLVTTKNVVVNVDTMVYNIRTGRSLHPSYPAQLTGWVSNMRFVKGQAIYTTDFSRPDSTLAPISGTVFLGFTTNDPLYDASPVKNTITRSGTTETLAFNTAVSGKRTDPQNYSVYFDGTGDYLYGDTGFVFTGDFTIEFWVYCKNPTEDSSFTSFFTLNYGGDWNANGNGLVIRSGGISYGSSGDTYNGPYTIPANQWLHIATVRSGSTISTYENGRFINSVTFASTIGHVNNKFGIGVFDRVTSTGGRYFLEGMISNLRVVEGLAVYTGEFVPPTGPLGKTQSAGTNIAAVTDPNSVLLLCCQDSTLIDNSNNDEPIYSANQAKPDANNPFGFTAVSVDNTTTGSGYFDGTGDYLTVPTNPSLNLEAENFTIEFWLNPSVLPSNYKRIFQISYTSVTEQAHEGILFEILNTNVLSAAMNGSNQVYYSVNASSAIVANQWEHWAFVRNGSTLTLYRNGVFQGTANPGTNAVNYASTFVGIIGRWGASTARDYNGYISNLRVVKGTAVYTGNFTPPTSPLTAIANTSLLTLQNRIGYNNSQPIDESGIKNIITRNGNASAGTFSPFGLHGWGAYNGGGSFQITNQNDCFNFGSNDLTVEFWARVRTTAAQQFFIDMRVNNNSNANLMFFVTGLNHGDGTNILSWANAPYTNNLDNWFHFAVVRNNSQAGDNWCAFVNGVPVDTGSFTGTVNTGNMRIFGRWDNNYSNWNADISNLRVTKKAVYTDFVNGFTPSSTSLEVLPETSVMAFRNSQILVTEPGPRLTVTAASASAAAITGPFKSHYSTPDSYSVYFDGSGDYLTGPTGDSTLNNALDILGGDYTIEFWLYKTANTSQAVATNFTNLGGNGWVVQAREDGAIAITHWVNNSSTAVTSNFLTYSINVWNHIAVVKNSGNYYFYVNGVDAGIFQNGSRAAPANGGAGTGLGIGAYIQNLQFASYVTGYISNLRIVKGTAVYTTDFDNNLPTSPLTAISGTSLLTCQSPTVIDNSTNDFAITVNGNSQPTKFNPFGETVTTGVEYSPVTNGGSVYLDADDHLFVNGSSGPLSITGDFTIDYYFYAKRLVDNNDFLFQMSGATAGYTNNQSSIAMVLYPSGQINVNLGATNVLTVGFYPGQWHHFAMSRKGTNYKIFFDGRQVYADTNNTLNLASYYNLSLGKGWDGSLEFDGYVHNFRVSKKAIYTSAFVPPIVPTAALPETTLLIRATNAAIQDRTGRNVLETVGNATLINESPYSLNKSVYFDGNGDYLFFGINDANLAVGSGDFTLESWVNFESITGDRMIYSRYDQGADRGFSFRLSTTNSPSGLRFYVGAGGGNQLIVQKAWSPSAGVWYHIALVRYSNNIYIYVDGQLLDTAVPYSGTIGDPTNTNSRIGAVSSGDAPFLGYISNLRLVKGTEVYTEQFSNNVPNQPLTLIAGTQLLACHNYNFTDGSANKFTITRNGEVRISSRGPFTETTTYVSSMKFDGTDDRLPMAANPDFAFGTGDFTVEFWMYSDDVSSSTQRGMIQTSATAGGLQGSYTSGIVIHQGANASGTSLNGGLTCNIAGTSIGSNTPVLTTGAWYYITLVRSGGTASIYVNGTLHASGTATGNCTGQNCVVGGYYNTSFLFKGYIDDLRITKGVARHTADFYPPDRPFITK